MRFEKGLAVACIVSLMHSSVQAVIPADVIQLAEDTLAADSVLVSQWMTSQLKYAIPFNSTAGNVVPSQLKLFGVEVGVQGVVTGTQVDVDGFHALPTSVVDTRSLEMFDRLPLPNIIGHAKVGLPFGLDAGVRLGGIPEKSIDNDNSKIKIKNKVFGLDVRKKLIDEGVVKPFGLTLGLNYTHADGSMDLTNSNITLNQVSVDGHPIDLTDGVVADHADWKTDSVGLQLLLDKKIFIITPYIGASTNYNSGHVTNSITTTGTASSTDYPGTTEDLSATGSSTAKPNKWDNRLLVGFELSILPFMKLGVGGEYAGNQNVAGSLGLRVQFH